MFCLTVICNYS